MARLPSVSRNPVLTQAPRSSLSASDIANPYRSIADAFGAIGTKLEEHEIRRSAEDGANAVYRDDQGNLHVDQRSNYSKAGEAYNRAAMQAYTARLAGDIRAKGTALANEAKGDVELFGSSWKGFSDTLLKGVPESARGSVATMLDTEGSRLGLGVSEMKRTRDIKTFEGNIKAEINALDDEMAALARAGGTGTQDYQQKQDQLRTLYGELATNPEFTVGDKEAEIAVRRMESRHTSEAMLGHIDRTLATGGVMAAKKEAEAILTNEKLDLTPAERRQYNGLANEAIRSWGAAKKVELEPFKEKSKKLQSLLDEGIGIDNADIDDTAKALAAGGDMGGALELYAARSRARQLSAFRASGNDAQVAALERGMEAAQSVNTGPVDGLVAAIRHVESGGNPNAVSSAGAIGSMQVMPGTAAEIARELGDANFPSDAAAQKDYLKRDDVSTRYGTHYLNKMMSRYGGDTEAALIAYNGGPARADAWIAAGRDDSVLPGETSAYYKKVMATSGAGSTNWLRYSNQSATRNQPLSPRLVQSLGFLGGMGVTMEVFSGGQPGKGSGGKRTGSTRHDHGNAADVFFYKDGRKLDWSNPADVPIFQEIVRKARANGVTGFGAGDGYMQRGSMHIGFGSAAGWGRGGRSENAPAWLIEAIDASPLGRAPAGTPDVDPKVIKEMRSEVTSDAKELWGDMKAGMEKNMPPSADEVNLLSRQLALIDDADFRTEVTKFFEQEAGASLIAELPADQAAAIISALKSDAADGATIAQQEFLAAAERGVAQRQEALKADPVGYAVDHKYVDPVPAIDLAGGPEAIGSAFASRQRAVDMLRARGDVGIVSALRPEDQQMLGRFIQTATPAEQAQLLGSMADNMKPTTYMATMAGLAEKKDTAAMAAAGALYDVNPEVAEGILRGTALLRENSKLAPSDNQDNREGIDTILPSAALGPGLEGQRQKLLEAATARYADLSNLAGDTSGELNEDRMTQAVNEVTGGMLDMNGSAFIAPRYGMTQEEFDTILSGLTDNDLLDAVTAEGEAITARDLRAYGRLKAVGANEYLIEFGPEGMGTFAMSRRMPAGPDDRRAPGPFTIRFGDR